MIYVYHCLMNFTIIGAIHFQTKNAEFKFVAYPSKGTNAEKMEKQYASFKLGNKIEGDTTIYRVTPKRNCLCDWYSHLTQPEWQYPFLKR
jgi:hypothetical protein